MKKSASSFTYKTLNKALGKAIHEYNMISDGDRIVVGLSGGKDSLSLMWMLAERLPRINIRYELLAVYIDPGFEGGFADHLAEYARHMGYNIRIEMTDCGIKGHSAENRENPCFLCSRLRRKRLFEVADEMQCNKIALGHNMDDLIETLFINICYAGEISTMLPSQPFFSGKVTIIRPLAFADANTIRRFAKQQSFPEFENPCPTAKISKRREIKDMLKQLYKINKKIKGNIFRALSHVKPQYLLK